MDLLSPAEHCFSRHCVQWHCAQSADCAYGFLWLYAGGKRRAVNRFFCGLLCDIYFGDVIGFYSLVMMYIGFLNGKFSSGFYPEDIKLPLALIVVSDLSYSIICYICMFLLRGRLDFSYFFSMSSCRKRYIQR